MNLMRRLFWLISLSLLLSGVALAQAVGGQDDSKTREGREVFAAVTRWADAVRGRDRKALDEIFAEELIVTAIDGTTRGKSDEIGILTSGSTQISSVNNEDLKVRVFGRAALVTGSVKLVFVDGDNERSLALRYTAVFVKENGMWRLAAVQSVLAPKAQLKANN
jgi:ketosteroid isomerase-like protein